MPYNRPYSLDEVVRILDASEQRPRPDIAAGNGPKGHAISLHTIERPDKFSRPGNIPEKDSTFLVTRNSLAAIVHEVLNSAPGQRELEKLNGSSQKSAKISSIILRQGQELDIFTVYRPKEGQTSFDWLSTTNGDGYIVQVFVLVYKIPNSTSDEIHIQTAFPKDFARTSGETIVFPK
jgi:hypothetical protein